MISLVFPVYNEEEVLPMLLSEISDFEIANRPSFGLEVIFVDDGSRDKSRQILMEAREQMPFIRVIGLSRNFGHQPALQAGVAQASGDAVVVMDADLQDTFDVVSKMISEWQTSGADVVLAKRSKRVGETWVKKGIAKLFYHFFGFLSDFEVERDVGDFRLMSKRAARQLSSLSEKRPYLRGLVTWIGFKRTTVGYVRPGRLAGDSKYSFRKSLSLALSGIISLSTKPLRLIASVAFVLVVFTALYGIWVLLGSIFWGVESDGWSSLVLIQLGLGSVQILILAIVALYLADVVEQVRGRPLYIIEFDSDGA